MTTTKRNFDFAIRNNENRTYVARAGHSISDGSPELEFSDSLDGARKYETAFEAAAIIAYLGLPHLQAIPIARW